MRDMANNSAARLRHSRKVVLGYHTLENEHNSMHDYHCTLYAHVRRSADWGRRRYDRYRRRVSWWEDS